MNSFQEEVLSHLQIGEWVIPKILPLFLAQLEKKNKDFRHFHQPLLAYENIAVNIEPFPMFFGQNFSENEEFKKIGNLLRREGFADLFNPVEVNQIQSSLISFTMCHPIEFNLFSKTMSGFLRIRNGNFSGASNPRAWGIYFLGDNFFHLNEQEKNLSFIHEMAHQELYLIQLLDRLVNKDADNSLVYAPLQKRPRPPIGRLHSLWALFRMIQASKKDGSINESFILKFEENARSFPEYELTEFGKNIVFAVKACVLKN